LVFIIICMYFFFFRGCTPTSHSYGHTPPAWPLAELWLVLIKYRASTSSVVSVRQPNRWDALAYSIPGILGRWSLLTHTHTHTHTLDAPVMQ
jgi:hypothetical protein